MTVAVMMAMTVAMSVMGMTMNKAVIIMAVVFVMIMVVVVRVVMPVAMIVIVRMVMIVAHGRSLRRTVLARQTAKMRALSHDDGQNQARPFPGRLQ